MRLFFYEKVSKFRTKLDWIVKI